MTLSETTSPERLKSFFEAWQQITKSQEASEITLSERLKSFFNSWSKLPKQIQLAETSIEIDTLEFEHFLTYLLPPAMTALKKWRSLGSEINVWEVAGLKHDEIRNSRVLNWLLDSYGSHGQGNLILLKFLSFLESHYPDFHKFDGEIGHYSSRVEYCPLGEKESRIDIEIDGQNFLLFIEVKINAKETNNQLGRYLESAKLKAGTRPWYVIYLTRNGKAPAQTNNLDAPRAKLSKHLIAMSWSDITNIINTHLKELKDDDFSRNSFTYHTIKQFISHIEQF